MMDMTDRDVLAEGAGIKDPGRYGIWNGASSTDGKNTDSIKNDDILCFSIT